MLLSQLSQVRFGGEFAERVRRSVSFLQRLNTAEMRRELAHPEEQWHWGADYIGRWIGVMSLISQYTGEEYGINRVVEELIDFQQADGSFGSFGSSHDYQEWFGMGRGLVGLLECYQARGNKAALESARKLGNYFFTSYPESPPHFTESYSSALEGLVLLYRITGQEDYLFAARKIATNSALYKRIWVSSELHPKGWRQPVAGQTHSQLLTARGLLDLYTVTGEDHFLEPVMAFYEFVVKELEWISGGIPEFIFLPEAGETCADADWLLLNLQLWGLTREVHYMDTAERVLLNQLYFDQTVQGGFCCWLSLSGLMGSTMDMCCAMHGLRAFSEVMRYAYTCDTHSISANLFIDGEVQLNTPSGTIPLSCRTSIVEGEFHAAFELSASTVENVEFRVRVPGWSESGRLFVNGQAVADCTKPGYLSIGRQWQQGDQVELLLSYKVSIVRGSRLGRKVIIPDVAAVFYGPRLFCFTDRQNPGVLPPVTKIDLTQPIQPLNDDLLSAQGVDFHENSISLKLTPISDVQGRQYGFGRMHPVRTPFYQVWLPVTQTREREKEDRKEVAIHQ